MLADQWMPCMTGVEFLTNTRELYLAPKRALNLLCPRSSKGTRGNAPRSDLANDLVGVPIRTAEVAPCMGFRVLDGCQELHALGFHPGACPSDIDHAEANNRPGAKAGAQERFGSYNELIEMDRVGVLILSTC